MHRQLYRRSRHASRDEVGLELAMTAPPAVQMQVDRVEERSLLPAYGLPPSRPSSRPPSRPSSRAQSRRASREVPLMPAAATTVPQSPREAFFEF